MVISPIIAFPYIIRGVYYQKKGAYVLFALFWGVIAYLSLPVADLFRHSGYYEDMQTDDIANVMLLSGGIENSVIPFAYYIMKTYGIPFDFLRLFQAFISIGLLTRIFLSKMKEKTYLLGRKDFLLRYIVLFLFFDFLYTIEGVRYGFGLCFLLYAYHEIFDRDSYIRGLLFAFVGTLIHGSLGPFFVISLILYKLNIGKRNVLIYGIIGILLINVIFLLINIVFPLLANSYFYESTEKGDSYSNLTLIGLTIQILLKLPILIFVYIYYKYGNNSQKWCRLFGVWLLISISSVPVMVLFQRSSWVLMAIGPFMFYSIEMNASTPWFLLKRIVLCGAFFTLINIFHNHDMIMNSNYHRLALPLPIILSQQYERDWLLQHVDGNDIIKPNNTFE